jgi:hypothetical protein
LEEGLLNVRSEQARQSTATLLKQIARSPQGHSYALAQLLNNQAAADAVPHHCGEYYKQFCELVKSIPELPADVSIGILTFLEVDFVSACICAYCV